MKPILVQMSTRRWTMPAVHLACALARNQHTEVILLFLIQASHASYLGTRFALRSPSEQEYADMVEYNATAQDYGVTLTVRPMECITTLDAVADAATILDAEVAFAHVPETCMPYLRIFRKWLLSRRFSAAQRQVFMLDTPNSSQSPLPSILVKPTYVMADR